MEALSETLRSSAADVALLGDEAARFSALSSTDLLAAQTAITLLRHCADRYAAMAAAEIAHRSRPEDGNAGLAQTAGFVSPEAMIQARANISRQEAIKLVQVGTLIAETEAAAALAIIPAIDASHHRPMPSAPPWQSSLITALHAGQLSIDAVESIRRALGDIDAAVTAEQLAVACEQLVVSAASATPDPLYRRARQLRDSLDEGGIERREKQRRDLRSLRTWWDASGMHCGSWRLSPEEGMIVASAFDEILSPRRGGPRFVDASAKAAAEELLNDERTNEQVAADALVDIVRLAVDADPGTMFGRRRPAVRVLVSDAHLRQRSGHGRIEGHPDPVSFATVERQLCDTGAIAIGFDDDGQCVNVGRNQRLFTERQRVGMAARDGGCLFPSCDRPPSYCEAHHIDQWLRDNGKTNIADGVLLCRRHHLLLHNNHWQVLRDGGNYFLKPPPDVDKAQKLIPMPSRNPAVLAIRQRRAG